jgi:hypothetical protein
MDKKITNTLRITSSVSLIHVALGRAKKKKKRAIPHAMSPYACMPVLPSVPAAVALCPTPCVYTMCLPVYVYCIVCICMPCCMLACYLTLVD